MRQPLLFFFAAITLGLASCQKEGGSGPEAHLGADSAVNAFGDSIRVMIAEAQHARDTEKLLAFTAANHSKKNRIAAIIGFGSVQDTSALPTLANLLQDSDNQIQAAAAYAIGQTGSATSVPALMDAAKIATDTALIVVVYEAIGKCGTADDLKNLVDSHKGYSPAQLNQMGLMAAFYRFGLRGIHLPETEEMAMQVLENGLAKAAFWASAFLGRVKDLGPVKNGKRLVAAFDKVKDPEARHHLARRFGRCKSPECQTRMEAVLADSLEIWPVKVNAVRALAEIKPSKTPEGILRSVEDLLRPGHGKKGHPQVGLEAANYLRDHAQPSDRQWILTLAQSTTTPSNLNFHAVKGGLWAAAVRLSKGNPAQEAEVLSLVQGAMKTCKSPYMRGFLWMALAQNPKHEQLLIDSVLPLKPVVSTYIMDGITAVFQNSQGNMQARAEFLNRMFGTGDVALVGQAAALVSDPKTGLYKVMTDSSAMHAALSKLAMPRDIETYNELRKALDLVAGKTGSKPAMAPPAPPINWAVVRTIPTQARWKIETDLGPITIRLAVEDAPATVGNIVRLAREGFFDNKYFHRIVPNFVSQGGCPRGDGWGSTDPMLRSEFSGLRYTRGAVGMASSGKDTESCQFFITHSAMPHLDGRYTVFGYVEAGISVAEKLDIGSRILKTTIEQ